MSIKKRKLRVIGPDHPQYLEKFFEAFGGGMSMSSRQASRCAEATDRLAVDQKGTHGSQPKPESSRPSRERPAGQLLANRESKED